MVINGRSPCSEYPRGCTRSVVTVTPPAPVRHRAPVLSIRLHRLYPAPRPYATRKRSSSHWLFPPVPVLSAISLCKYPLARVLCMVTLYCGYKDCQTLPCVPRSVPNAALDRAGDGGVRLGPRRLRSCLSRGGARGSLPPVPATRGRGHRGGTRSCGA